MRTRIPLAGLLALAGALFAAPALAADGSLFGWTVADLLTIGTTASVFASIITSTVPTPSPESRWATVYRIVELVAIVGQRAKSNPAAVADALRLSNAAASARTVQEMAAVADQAAILARTLSPTAPVLDPSAAPRGVSAL